MAMAPRVRRRDILAILSALGFVTPAVGMETLVRGRRAPLQESLLATFKNRETSLKRVGEAYLEIAANEQSPETLVTNLFESMPALERAVLDGNVRAMRIIVKRRCSIEFSRQQTVSLEGWVVSLTEARLCAFYAITA